MFCEILSTESFQYQLGINIVSLRPCVIRRILISGFNLLISCLFLWSSNHRLLISGQEESDPIAVIL